MQYSYNTKKPVKSTKSTIIVVNALQNYLHERGISPDGTTPNSNDGISDDSAPALGGVYRPISAELPYGNRFNQNTQKVLDTIKNVPIGLPYTGTITSGFGNRSNPFGGHRGENHSGLDFRGPVGDAILATADGVVVQAGRAGGYGNAVKISHGYQLETLYAHMSEVDVTVGQKIKAGDTVGKLGNTGRSTGPHLHYEVRRNGTPVDPVEFLNLQEM